MKGVSSAVQASWFQSENVIDLSEGEEDRRTLFSHYSYHLPFVVVCVSVVRSFCVFRPVIWPLFSQNQPPKTKKFILVLRFSSFPSLSSLLVSSCVCRLLFFCCSVCLVCYLKFSPGFAASKFWPSKFWPCRPPALCVLSFVFSQRDHTYPCFFFLVDFKF